MHIFMDRLLLFCSSVVRFLLNLFSFIRFKSSPHRSVHINALPEECLLAIFDQLPLSDLIRLDQICHQWALLLPSATVRRLTLVLIIDGYGLDGMCFDIPFNDDLEISYDRYRPYFNLPVSERDAALTLPFLVPRSFDQFLFSNLDLNGFFDILYHTTLGGHTEANFTEMARLKHARLTGQLSTYFGDLFPNVNTLLVIHPECFEAELQSVVDLLGAWPLINLKLWLHTVDIDERYEHFPDRHPVGNLLRSINHHQQPSLQQLTLSIEGVRKTDETIKFAFPVEHYSFVGQLKVAKLSLGFYDTDNSIWQTVHRLDSTKLRYIGLGNRADLYENDALNPQFEYAHKVRQLYSHRSFETVQVLGKMCSRFNLLNMLEIYWLPNITFTELTAKLASLPHLTCLKLEISFELQPVNAFALVDQVSGDQQKDQPRQISLPQVKILKFLIKKRTHQDFESFSPNVFPSVESIIVDNVRSPPVTECIICRPNANGPHNPKMANQCNRMLICSLKDKFAKTNSSIRIYPEHATSVDTPTLDASFIQHPMMTNVSKGDVVVLLVNVVNMFIFHVYAFSKMADQLIYSDNTDQSLKQSLNDTKFYMMFNVLTNTLWVLARFGCMASYITWQSDNSKVVDGRKILNVLKSGSYATALLLSLVTGLAIYYLIYATTLMSSSTDKVVFRFLLGLVYLLLMGLTILVELLMGTSFCRYKIR